MAKLVIRTRPAQMGQIRAQKVCRATYSVLYTVCPAARRIRSTDKEHGHIVGRSLPEIEEPVGKGKQLVDVKIQGQLNEGKIEEIYRIRKKKITLYPVANPMRYNLRTNISSP